MNRYAVALLVFLAWEGTAHGGVDTLLVSFTDVEALIRARNFEFQAATNEARALRAEAAQARVFDNPQFSLEAPLYTGSLHKWFDMGSTGQIALGVDQSLNIGGARSYSSQAGYAGADAASADANRVLQAQTFDALRAYVTLNFAQQSYNILTGQLELLDELLTGFSEQLAKGHVSLKDVLRLKASYYAINDERSDVHVVLLSARSALQMLTGTAEILVPRDTVFGTATADSLVTEPSDSLISMALDSRMDIQSAKLALQQATLQVTADTRRRIPDPTIGVSYDRAGSYALDYVALNLSVPIPVLNQYTGTIQASQAREMSARANLERARIKVTSEVLQAIDRYRVIAQEADKMDKYFLTQTQDVTRGIADNYRKGNISLLEFVDFFETYNQTIVRANMLFANLVIAREQLRYAVGK